LDHQALLVVRHDAAALAELRRQLPATARRRR